MNMIFTLTLRNLLSNKKRTLLTLLTILLSISMITAILCGGWSLVDFLKEKEKVYGGDYDYYMEDLTWEQVQELYSQNNVGEVSLLRFAGNSFYGEKSNSTMLSVGEIDENFTQKFSLNQYLLAGRFPQDENELIISESFLKKNNMNTEIGDTISLTLGSRIWDEYNAQLSGLTNYRGEEESFVPTKEKAYVVVGILSDVNDSKIAANYNAFAGVDKTASDFAAYVKAKNLSNSIYAEAEEVAAAVDSHVAKFHSELLVYHGITGGKGAAKVIALVVMVMCLLMAASASMISNALSISLQERIKQMGMLSSIGATKGQKRLSVYLEAFLLGVVSIPLGLVVGILLSALLLSVVRAAFGETFTFGIVELSLKVNGLILLVSGLSGIASLCFGSRKPVKQAAKITVIEAIRQSNNEVSKKKFRDGKIVSLVFGIYGSLAAKNIKRNPKRFRAITGSIFLSVVVALSLYSLSDFMLYQTSLDMKEDGSCYTDVISTIQYKDIPAAIGALSDENITADVSYSFQRYMTAEFSQEQINPDMQGYFINGTKAEVYVVGLDEEHFTSFCEENGFHIMAGSSNRGILLNQTMGYYNAGQNRVIAGSPFLIEPGTEIVPLGEGSTPIVVDEIISEENANVQSMFVRDRAVLIVPLSYFNWLIDDNAYVEMRIQTAQHKEAMECLADRGFPQTVDIAAATNNSRQVYTIAKLAICLFSILMTVIISLNVCNTISNTIHLRRSEFAVLRSVGMTAKGLKCTLLLEAVLYGVKALVLALPVSFLIHCAIYYFISSGMTPFAFYINGGIYVLAVLAVSVMVCVAMLFAFKSVSRVEIVKELKLSNM